MRINDLTFKEGDVVGFCHKCGGDLVIREGMFGQFVGCTGYRNGCRNSCNLNKYEINDEVIYEQLKILSLINEHNIKELLKVRDSELYNSLSDSFKNRINEALR